MYYYKILDYEEIFQKAELTFLHQRVFDYNKNELINLTPIDLKSWPLKYTNNDFLGPNPFFNFYKEYFL